MANGNYVGRFGDTLRRLTALQAQQGAFSGPQQIGGADTAGAFSVARPGAMEAPAAPQPPAPTPEPAAPESGFGAGAAADTPQPADDSAPQGGMDQPAPITWKDVSSAMPAEHKKQIADQIESHVGDLKATYQQVARQNGITPKPRASRMHMAMYLAEIALRAAANRGTSQSDGEALAKGVLQTQDHREAMRLTEEARQRAEAEQRRKEDREDAIRQEGYDRGDTMHARDRQEKLDDDKRNHEQALELERMRLAAEKARARGERVKIVVADDGSYKLIDLDNPGRAVPVEEEVTETTPEKGSRGQGTTGGKPVTTKRPVKARPPTNASGLDQDRVQTLISDRIKTLQKEDRTFRKKSPEEQSRIATELVMREVESARGANGDTASGGKVIDFNDL